jgi:hypothetical protein
MMMQFPLKMRSVFELGNQKTEKPVKAAKELGKEKVIVVSR